MENKIKELRKALDKISGILDNAYECAKEEEQEYINEVESELRGLLCSLFPEL